MTIIFQRFLTIDICIVKERKKKGKVYYKVGRSNDVKKRLNEWEKQCGYSASLIAAKACKYTHRAERLIHLELESSKVGLARCTGCDKVHNEWFNASKKEITNVINNWVNYINDVYGKARF